MNIGQRLRELRESKGLSQGHIQERTGLLRCYISRVECGHTNPTIETVEKWAKALGLELYQVFYLGEGELQEPETAEVDRPGTEQQKLLKVFDKLVAGDRTLLRALARTLAGHRTRQRVKYPCRIPTVSYDPRALDETGCGKGLVQFKIGRGEETVPALVIRTTECQK